VKQIDSRSTRSLGWQEGLKRRLFKSEQNGQQLMNEEKNYEKAVRKPSTYSQAARFLHRLNAANPTP